MDNQKILERMSGEYMEQLDANHFSPQSGAREVCDQRFRSLIAGADAIGMVPRLVEKIERLEGLLNEAIEAIAENLSSVRANAEIGRIKAEMEGMK